MEMIPRSVRAVRFGPFEVDLRAGELRKQDRRIRLPDQPLHILTVLLEHPGEMVTREELRQRLWPADTFVDFDHGLNNAINRLREVLGDSADAPRYIETLPRRGYRFVGALEPTADRQAPARDVSASARSTASSRLVRRAATILVAAALLLVGVVVGRQRLLPGIEAGRIRSLAVLPLEN